MFFYTSVFIASVVLSLVVIWLCRAVMDAGSVVYRAILPSAKSGMMRRLFKKNSATTPDGVSAPWGWGGDQKPDAQARSHPSAPVAQIPWGWPGNTNPVRGHDRSAQGGGDPSSFIKRQAPVKAETFHSKTAMQHAGKPWGW